ncbi:CPBP family intramembrane metalloprotease [Nocardia panacis]|uniref:CPBP family intramembrane metalloprotease n=1 Tax=Nocardia panacis TaxID=2340916 RepID=A0A3A4K5C7_9NOCA|nr:type II CAAX endopeptidase family protein [Nocardia panacis]RJO73701.1 CPBP family intramembrane metalloprotease [Nocardia panacis]
MTNGNAVLSPRAGDSRRRSGRELVIFLVAAYLGAWLVAAPLWVTGFRRVAPGQEATTLATVCLFTMMVVPATVAVVLTRWRHPWRAVPQVLSLGLPGPRVLAQCVGAGVIFPAIAAVGLLPAAAIGVFRPGWPQSWAPLLTMLVSALISLPLYLGEEIGWQGYMLPRLTFRYGPVLGIGVGGVLWGLWHLPMTALGGSYPGHPLYVAIPMAVGAAVGIGAVIAAIRIHTRSVWPAVAAHAGLNEFALRLPRFFAARDHIPDPLIVGPLGLITWPILMVAAGFALYSLRTRRPGLSSGAAHSK